MESIKSTNNNCVQYKCFNFCSFYSYLNNRRPFPCRVYIASSRHKGTYSRVCITFASSHNLRVCRCMRLHKYSIAFKEYSQKIKRQLKGKYFYLLLQIHSLNTRSSSGQSSFIKQMKVRILH